MPFPVGPRQVPQFSAGQRFALDIAGRRLLRLVVAGSGGAVGQPGDPIEAAKWHFISRGAGLEDPWLDDFVAKLTEAQREAARERAGIWLSTMMSRAGFR